jgi:hypothetical protein
MGVMMQISCNLSIPGKHCAQDGEESEDLRCGRRSWFGGIIPRVMPQKEESEIASDRIVYIIMNYNPYQQGRCSIVVSIPACHAGDPGSIPGNGVSF